MTGTMPSGWEALNDVQRGLLTEQRRELELAEAGILNSAQTLLGNAAQDGSITGLVNPQTLVVFRDQDRWKSLSTNSQNGTPPRPPTKNDVFKGSASWTGIRSQLDAEDQCEVMEKVSQFKSKTPTASRLEYREMKTYGGMPMTDEVVVVTCLGCQKPIIPSAYKEHRSHCRLEQKESGSVPLTIRTDLLDKKSDSPKIKKRKESLVDRPQSPSTAREKSPTPQLPDKKPYEKKQKLAKPPKVKPPGRVKGPLDLDKQCGVVVPGGAQCTRSLTCKSHSMSAKRAVEGRSRPYDTLLGSYQKKPMPVKDEKQSRLASEIPLAEKEDANMDSDEEYNDLLDAVRSYEPRPLAVPSTTYVRRRNNCMRIRDLLFDALKGPCRPILPNNSTNDGSSMHL